MRDDGKTRGTLSIEVCQDCGSWSHLKPLDPARGARRVASVLARGVALPARRCGATLVLSSDAAVRELNRQWRGLDKPTNVLSFPSGSPPGHARGARHHLGDVILAQETLVREAVALGIAPGDHFCHLVLHGLLHLLGWDHETDAEAEEMEALETRILATLGVADPYAGSKPAPAARTAPRQGGRRP